MHVAGQHFKKNYELPYIALVSEESEHKAKSSGRNLMEFVKPAVSCPIECNRLLVCVRVSASGMYARSSEQVVRTLRRADCPHALATGLLARLMRALLPRAPAVDCSCLALRWRPPPTAAATAPQTVACSGSSGPGGLQL